MDESEFQEVRDALGRLAKSEQAAKAAERELSASLNRLTASLAHMAEYVRTHPNARLRQHWHRANGQNLHLPPPVPN